MVISTKASPKMAIIGKNHNFGACARMHTYVMRVRISKLGRYLKIPKRSFLAFNNFPEILESSNITNSGLP